MTRTRLRAGGAISHGTSRGYLTGCRRRDECPRSEQGLSCVEARNRAQLKRARARGVPQRPAAVDASPAAERIDQWRNDGLSLREIARMSGVGHTTITNVANRTTLVLWPATFEQIMSARALARAA